MTFGTKCREALAKERERLGGKITPEQWDAVVDGLVVIEAIFRKKKPSAKRPKEGRPRNPLFDALALATGTKDLALLTRAGGRAIGVALADIIEVSPGLTPEEITRCAELYRQKNPTWPLTAPALAKNWAQFARTDRTRAAKRDIYQEPDGWKTSEAARSRVYTTGVSKETWANLVAEGWFQLGTSERKEILSALFP